MKLGFRDMRLFNGDWDVLLAFASEVGAETVQIDLPADVAVDRLRGLVEKSGIAISSITAMSTRLLGPDAEASRQDQARVRRAIAAASALGVPCVSQFAGNDPARSFEENMATFREVFLPLAQLAEESGVCLVFENCPLVNGLPPVVRNMAYSPAAWDAMFEAVASPAIALELDTAHLPWLGIDVVRCIHDYADRIRHVHLKDCIVDAEQQYRFGRLDERFYRYGVPGDGGIDFAAVVECLRVCGYGGSLTLDLLPTTKETISQGMTYMRPIVNAANQRIGQEGETEETNR